MWISGKVEIIKCGICGKSKIKSGIKKNLCFFLACDIMNVWKNSL